MEGALSRGVEALAGLDASELEYRSGADVSRCRSPFAAAVAASALAEVPEGRSLARPLLIYLRRTAEPPGLWHFSRRDFPDLPLDADDTACALAALFLHGDRDVAFGPALEVIQRFARGDGPCRTWLTAGDPRNLPGGENDVDVVVNANVLYCAALAGRSLAGAAAFVAAWVASHGIECRRASAYYPSPFAFAYFLARWLGACPQARGTGLASIVTAACSHRLRQVGEDPLAGALALNALLDLAPRRQAVRPLAAMVLAHQGEGGLWPQRTFFLGPHGMTFGSAALTTALALEALAKLGRLRRLGCAL